ncbi:MAG: hypothetical protein CL397_05735 [Acidiferrobacteraceae bacterium]|nr:hypothetical protein [Acidiferrobacteraceae bacterium]
MFLFMLVVNPRTRSICPETVDRAAGVNGSHRGASRDCQVSYHRVGTQLSFGVAGVSANLPRPFVMRPVTV